MFRGTVNFFVIVQFFRILSGQIIAFCRPAKEDGGRIVDISSESQLSCPLSSLEPSLLKATGRVKRAIFCITEEGRSQLYWVSAVTECKCGVPKTMSVFLS